MYTPCSHVTTERILDLHKEGFFLYGLEEGGEEASTSSPDRKDCFIVIPANDTRILTPNF